MKLSKSEAGKLGAEKSKSTLQKKKETRILEYNLNPNICGFCQTNLTYENKKNKFCSSSCAASFNNLARTKKIRLGYPTNEKKDTRVPVSWLCLNCSTVHSTVAWRIHKYCSLKCQHDYQYKTKVDAWLINNVKPGFGVIKRYLSETFGYKCAECGISNYNNKPLTLEIEHKDGNSENYMLNNLCFLCPNCHSQTSTYKAKNKGNGRHARRQRYKEGKSY